VAREAGVLSGEDIFTAAMSLTDPAIRTHFVVHDAETFTGPTVLATIEGPAQGVLQAERVALNFVQRMSGIATLTAQYVAAVAGTSRKLCKRCAPVSPTRRNVEVEVDRPEQIETVLAAGADTILLDNFSTAQPASAVAQIAGRALVEPRRLRRRDPTSVRALERVYDAYDRILEGAAANLGADRPAVITTSPFVAGFSPLRWAGGVTFFAWDDWPSGLPVRRWWTASRR